MFKIFKPKPPVEKLRSDIQLERVIEMLFPTLEIKTAEDGVEYYVDSSVDSNLDAALMDLEDGTNDDLTRNTIRKVSNRLFEVRKYLHAHNELDPSINRLLVEDVETSDIKIEDIKVKARPD